MLFLYARVSCQDAVWGMNTAGWGGERCCGGAGPGSPVSAAQCETHTLGHLLRVVTARLLPTLYPTPGVFTGLH